MRPAVGFRLNYWLRGAVPAALALCLLVLGVVPLGLPNFVPATPLLPLAAVYYWAIYRPDLMPAPLAFGLGLLHDILTGGPPGQMALVLLLVQGACLSQRRAVVGKSFLVDWVGFALIAAGAYAGAWLLACVYYFALIDPTPVLAQWLMTLILYPPLARLFSLSHGWITRVTLE